LSAAIFRAIKRSRLKEDESVCCIRFDYSFSAQFVHRFVQKMFTSTVKFLLAGCLFYFSFAYCDASTSTSIASVATAVVEQNVPDRVYKNIYGHGGQLRRFKREVVSKTLPDPDSCIRTCRHNETTMIMTATLKNVAKLVSLALADIDGDELSTPAREAAFKKEVEEKTIANMGPFFQDLCKISKKTDDCYTQCPNSQLRNITVIDHDATEVFCEPGTNWNNFTEYWHALNCTNATEMEKPCENKCGVDVTISNVTNLEVDASGFELPDDDDEESEEKKDTKEGGAELKYETDAKKNTAAVGPVCKTTSCQLDCYKPIMTERCGAKASDLYARMTKMEPRTSLRILKLLNAVEPNSDCKIFQ